MLQSWLAQILSHMRGTLLSWWSKCWGQGTLSARVEASWCTSLRILIPQWCRGLPDRLNGQGKRLNSRFWTSLCVALPSACKWNSLTDDVWSRESPYWYTWWLWQWRLWRWEGWLTPQLYSSQSYLLADIQVLWVKTQEGLADATRMKPHKHGLYPQWKAAYS